MIGNPDYEKALASGNWLELFICRQLIGLAYMDMSSMIILLLLSDPPPMHPRLQPYEMALRGFSDSQSAKIPYRVWEKVLFCFVVKYSMYFSKTPHHIYRFLLPGSTENAGLFYTEGIPVE